MQVNKGSSPYHFVPMLEVVMTNVKYIKLQNHVKMIFLILCLIFLPFCLCRAVKMPAVQKAVKKVVAQVQLSLDQS